MVEESVALRDNVVWLDKNRFVHAVLHGDQTREKLRALVAESEELANELLEHDHPVLMLADIRDIGDHHLDTRLVGIRARSQLPFWRLAIVVPKTDDTTSAVSRKLTAMSSRKNDIRYFTSLPDAHHWLNELQKHH